MTRGLDLRSTEHRDFLGLVLLFIVFRALAVLFLRPGGFLADGTFDQFFYYETARLSAGAQYPYLNYWIEYPPLFPWLNVAAYKISLMIPPWFHILIPSGFHKIFWFNAILRFMMLPFETGSLVLIYAIAKRLHSRELAFRAAFSFALLFIPLFVFLGWFDSIVLFFILLSLYGVARGSPIVAGLGIGVGFGVKLFPIAVLPAAIRTHWTPRKLLLLIAIVTLSVSVIFGPFLIVSPDYTLAFFRTLSGWASWETVWALLDGNYRPGTTAPLKWHNDPTATDRLPSDLSASALPWTWITLAFGLLGLFLWTRPIDWQDPRRITAFVGLTFVIMFLYGKGYSPQWNLYLATLAVILLPGMRGAFYGVAFSVLAVLEWPVTFVIYWGVPGFLTAVVIIRTVLIVVLGLEFAANIYPEAGWLRLVAKRLPASAATGLVLAGIVGIGPAFAAYRAIRLEQEPLAPLLAALQADTTTRQIVLTAQPSIVERLSPVLPQHISLEAMPGVSNTPWVEPTEWLDETLDSAELQIVWFVHGGEASQAGWYVETNEQIDRHLSETTCKWSSQRYADTLVEAYFPIHPTPDIPLEAQFDEQIGLTGYGLTRSDLLDGHTWCITLAWTALSSIEQDYIVLIQLRDMDGGLCTEHMLEPVGGTHSTSGWQPGEAIEDAHGLRASLPPGRYTLYVTLLNPETGAPLPASGKGVQPDDAIQLEEILVE